MHSIEKRRYIWTITNFTQAKVSAYSLAYNPYQVLYAQNQRKHSLCSNSFEIALGDNNTKWHFVFYPIESKDYSAFFVNKEAADHDNFTISLNAAVRTSDYKILPLCSFKRAANEFELGKGWGFSEFLEVESIFDHNNKYLLNDTLTLVIDIKLRRNDALEAVQQNPLAGAVGYLFNSKKFSDITFVCSDEKEFPAHQCILGSRSPVFSTMLAADMLEKKSARFIIDDIDGDTMHEVLRFIYTNTVENLSELAKKLIYAAEKYDLQDLKSMCAKELMTQITSDTVFELLVFADRFNKESLLEECVDFIDLHFGELKAAEGWKKISNDLMMKCLQYKHEIFDSMITFISSL